MERVLSIIANALTKQHHITVITAFNGCKKDFFPYKSDICRIDLGLDINNESDKTLRNKYKDRLSNYLKQNRQDYVISLGSLEFFFLYSIDDGSKKIVWFHFALNRMLFNTPFKKYPLMHKLIGRLKQLRIIYIAKKYDKIIVLSKSDLRIWRRFTNKVVCIYNPITIPQIREKANYTSKKAIAVGRLDYQKGFDYLINAWKIVNAKHSDWVLDIYGDGPLKYELQHQILINNLESKIFLKGICNNIEKEYLSHSIFILTSRYEGFGLVLLEAASCGLPLVSYNCEFGPSEIIEHDKNGTLIEPVGDIYALANAINDLIENEGKRCFMGKEAKNMSSKFSLENVIQEWTNLFSPKSSYRE